MSAKPTCTLGQEPWVAGAQLTHMWAQRATLFPCWSPGEISSMELAWLAVLYVPCPASVWEGDMPVPTGRRQ